MAKYKVGDKVRIKDDLKVGRYYGGYFLTAPMAEHFGKTTTVCEVHPTTYSLSGCYSQWWTNEMLERVPAGEIPPVLSEDEDILFLDIPEAQVRYMTNREAAIRKIASFSNKQLAKLFSEADCDYCPLPKEDCSEYSMDCHRNILAWLEKDSTADF